MSETTNHILSFVSGGHSNTRGYADEPFTMITKNILVFTMYGNFIPVPLLTKCSNIRAKTILKLWFKISDLSNSV